MSLPQEILDLVVDELSDDITSLTLCSGTSSRLHYRAATRLFADISLTPKNYRAFIDLITASPYLSGMVRTLRIYGGPLARDQYISVDRDLSSTLQTLSNVRHLHVRSAFLGRFLAVRNPSLFDALLAFPLHSIRIDDVYFNDIEDLMDTVSLVPSLRRLHVGALLSIPTPAPIPPRDYAAWQLTELCVDMGASGSIVHALLSMEMRNLHTLELNGCSAYDIATINGVLTRCPVQKLVMGRSHLCTSFKRTFWSQGGGGGATGPHGPNLYIDRLRELEITVGDLYTQLQWWVDAFRRMGPKEEVLLHLLKINLEVSTKSVQPRSWFQPSRWRALDEALGRLPSLKCVDTQVDSSLYDRLAAIVDSECASLIDRGIMTLSV